jgi:UDP-N-acetylglucosamine 2-epimerase
MRVLVVVGTRTNFVKISQVFNGYFDCCGLEFSLVHAGQYYDEKASEILIDQIRVS